MLLLDAHEFPCPWCGEPNAIELDPDEAGQTLIQDCAVCCRPIELKVPLTPGEWVQVSREGE